MKRLGEPRLRRWRSSRLLAPLALLAVVVAVVSCTSVTYYAQSARGQLGILNRRDSIDKLLRRDDLDADVRRRLERILAMRRFAAAELDLPADGSYRGYAELDRDYALWNVVATPEFGLTPVEWCFPIAGCVSYRGYFSEDRARRFAAKLERRGLDVAVSGVPAYSTLGWFADPVLSTWIGWAEEEQAALLFHELTHQRLYIKGETLLNESLATVVEEEGMQRWFADRPGDEGLERYRRGRRLEQDFVQLLAGARQRLADLYASGVDEETMRRGKTEAFAALSQDYRELRDSWEDGRYDRWFSRQLNNAHLAGVALYQEAVPELRALLESCHGDLGRFFARLERWRRDDLQPSLPEVRCSTGSGT